MEMTGHHWEDPSRLYEEISKISNGAHVPREAAPPPAVPVPALGWARPCTIHPMCVVVPFCQILSYLFPSRLGLRASWNVPHQSSVHPLPRTPSSEFHPYPGYWYPTHNWAVVECFTLKEQKRKQKSVSLSMVESTFVARVNSHSFVKY